ncbi:class I SAM-dependent methyltransferase [Pseudonocardia spinosispora]|uniref:class I SAM-dependent methyltransferase n=1 Tax=Pseudonocardia spinosispora TaxID=103441 RepID=UPI001B7FDDC8|nr:class I SAM-dependent methyltransferase [Pseudonocardia spinosispora]
MSESERGAANLELLLTADGQALLGELAGSDVTDELRVASVLRRRFPGELVTAALAQHELRRRGRSKFSRAESMWLTRDGFEQSSSELLSRHRAVRYSGADRAVDLCCGIGGDLIGLAGAATSVVAVDRDPLHLRMALLNAEVYDVAGSVTGWLGDVRDVDLTGVDAVFVDPARRSGGRRLRTGSSEPPLDWCVSLADRVGVGIKAAPGLDRSTVPPGWEVEFVADGRDLKEAVLWSPSFAEADSRATLLPDGHQLVPSPGDTVECRAPGAYLLDPNPAVTRAGLVEELARELGAWKIDPRIAFLSSDAPLVTPFGRCLRVVSSLPWKEKSIIAELRRCDVGSVDIRRRGLAGDVALLQRRLKLTGSLAAVLVMTRVDDQPWGIICLG